MTKQMIVGVFLGAVLSWAVSVLIVLGIEAYHEIKYAWRRRRGK